MKKENKISFYHSEKHNSSWTLDPVPARKYLPEWYKTMPKFVDQNFFGIEKYTSTIKSCPPFFDAITAGYFILLSADILVSRDELDGCHIQWRTNTDLVTKHIPEQVPGIPRPPGYGNFPFKWINFYIIKTPKNHSTFFTHPLSMPDLPFYSLPGLVDTDSFNLPVQFPFFIKKDFEGVIPKGTPIIQAIPFKRNNWKMYNDEPIQDFNERQENLFSNIKDSYKKMFWSKKYYN